MRKTYIFEGNTTNEAIEKGLKELNVSKNQVEIKVLEENKRSFFSILAPRIVKVEMTLKESHRKSVKPVKREIVVTEEDIEKSKIIIEKFINEFTEKMNVKDVEYTIKYEESLLKVNFEGDKLKVLIGYRGETLNAFENILNAILKSNHLNIRVFCNINNFRESRVTALNELADKVSKTVTKTGKKITLEPMSAYERKIIHTRLQNHNTVTTYSIGEGIHRRIVIALK